MKFAKRIFVKGLILSLLLLVLWGGSAFAALVDNGDGTVSDTETGLMWQQAEAGAMNWQTALNYCENLVLPAGGYDDWRLPGRNELQSLIDYDYYNPAIYNHNINGGNKYFPELLSSGYWSSTTDAYYTDFAWHVYFGYGFVSGYNKSLNYYVRAVRSGQSGSLVDLTISAVVPASGTAGASLQVPVTVNCSGGTLNGIYATAALYWSPDAAWQPTVAASLPPGGGKLWDSNNNEASPDFPTATLNSSGSKTVNATVTLPTGVSSCYIIAFVDRPYSDHPNGYHTESNENNNQAHYAMILNASVAPTLLPLSPDPNPAVSEVMAGGSLYRYYRLVDSVSGNPLSGKMVTVDSAGCLCVFYSDSDGQVVIEVPADNLGVPGELVNCTVTTPGAAAVSINVKILPRQSVSSYAFGSGISVGAGAVVGVKVGSKRGLVYQVVNNTDIDPSTDDPVLVSRQIDLSAGVKVSSQWELRFPGLLRVTLVRVPVLCLQGPMVTAFPILTVRMKRCCGRDFCWPLSFRGRTLQIRWSVL